MDLLRWWWFLHAVDVGWDPATRLEARDFSCWNQVTVKQRRQPTTISNARSTNTVAGAPNAVTGKPAPGDGYAPATVAHGEMVLRSFYDFHRDEGTGPILNPVPLDRSRRSRRAHAHHNPWTGGRASESGATGRRCPTGFPRAIPDQRFNELFAAGVQPGPCAGGVLDLHRSTGVGIAGSAAVRRRSGPAVNHLGAQGHPRGAAGSGVYGRVRLLRLYQEQLRGEIPWAEISRCGGHCDDHVDC